MPALRWEASFSNFKSVPDYPFGPQTRVYFYFTFYKCIVPMQFLPWEFRVAFPGESQLRKSRATQPTVHAGCFNVNIIHRTLDRKVAILNPGRSGGRVYFSRVNFVC